MEDPILKAGIKKPIKPFAAFDSETKHRIRKHLSDINDVITEEDIKNIRTDIYEAKDTKSKKG